MKSVERVMFSIKVATHKTTGPNIDITS